VLAGFPLGKSLLGKSLKETGYPPWLIEDLISYEAGAKPASGKRQIHGLLGTKTDFLGRVQVAALPFTNFLGPFN
jgi:hypothetical protein